MMMSVGEWVSGQVFQYVHGNNLVYNMCWEDPRLDRVALELQPKDNLLVITSAGCNALDYLFTGLNHVYAVDMNPRQNALLELKIAGIKNLDYATFFRMFGEGRLPGIRKIYEEHLRDDLTIWSQKYWDRKIKRYFGGRRNTFYFHGTSGAFARMINTYIDRIGRFRKEVERIFEVDSIEEQREIWNEKIRKRLWSRPIRFLINRDASLSMLGVPRAQRLQIENQYEGGIVKFVQDCLDAVFGELPLADNYFWRCYSTGSYTKHCCPEYLKEENFQKLKEGLVEKVTIFTDTVEGFLRKHDDVEISRYVLLDHMDWLSDRYYEALVSEWQAIVDRAAPETRIIWRSGGLRTEYVDSVPVTFEGHACRVGDILTYHLEKAESLHRKCRVHTYGSFYIADLDRRRMQEVAEQDA